MGRVGGIEYRQGYVAVRSLGGAANECFVNVYDIHDTGRIAYNTQILRNYVSFLKMLNEETLVKDQCRLDIRKYLFSSGYQITMIV